MQWNNDIEWVILIESQKLLFINFFTFDSSSLIFS